jgi:hypothetical protein
MPQEAALQPLLEDAWQTLARAGFDREFTLVLDSGRAGGRSGMDTVPGRGLGGAVAVGFLRCSGVRGAPGVRLGEAEMLSDEARAMADQIIGSTPPGRLGLPADLAAVVALPACEDARWITGHVIGVNGGFE